jgi:hypothetical protein
VRVGRYEEWSAWVRTTCFVESGTQGHVPARVRTYVRRRGVHGSRRVALAVAAAAVVDAVVAVDGVDGVDGILCAPWKECWK